MTINTKLNIGDECFILFENKIRQVTVQEINAFTDLVSGLGDAHQSHITYAVEFLKPVMHREERSMVLNESDVFSTKAELLASL